MSLLWAIYNAQKNATGAELTNGQVIILAIVVLVLGVILQPPENDRGRRQ